MPRVLIVHEASYLSKDWRRGHYTDEEDEIDLALQGIAEIEFITFCDEVEERLKLGNIDTVAYLSLGQLPQARKIKSTHPNLNVVVWSGEKVEDTSGIRFIDNDASLEEFRQTFLYKPSAQSP